VSLATLGLGAAPATAGDAGSSFASPPAGTVTTATPGVSGDAHIDGGCLKGIDLVVNGPSGFSQANTHFDGSGGKDQHFDWNPSPTFSYNGAYRAVATVHFDPTISCGVVLGGDTTFTVPREFSVAVLPAKPSITTSSVDRDRQVTVSWTRNTEPDLIGYAVYRIAKSGSGCQGPGASDAPVGGGPPATTFTDPFGTTAPGGVFCYTVKIVRRGATPTEGVYVFSDPVTVTVPAPPPPPTQPTVPGATTVPGAGGTPAPGGTPGAPGAPPGAKPGTGGPALAQSGKVDLSNFAKDLNNARRVAPNLPGPLEIAPAPGGPDVFKPNLPFGSAGADQTEDGPVTGPGSASASRRLHQSDNSAKVRTAGTFAGGLVATVVLGHLLVLRREIDRPAALEVAEPGAG